MSLRGAAEGLQQLATPLRKQREGGKGGKQGAAAVAATQQQQQRQVQHGEQQQQQQQPAWKGRITKSGRPAKKPGRKRLSEAVVAVPPSEGQKAEVERGSEAAGAAPDELDGTAPPPQCDVQLMPCCCCLPRTSDNFGQRGRVPHNPPPPLLNVLPAGPSASS